MPVFLPLIWVACAIVIVVAAIRCPRHASALMLGRYATATLFLGAGAAVNAVLLAQGGDAYEGFADTSYLPFVRDTWHSLVMTHRYLWILLLIAFEVAVGILVLLGGRLTQLAYLAAIGFHIALLAFGWGFFLWSVPMIASLTTLFLAERRAALPPGHSTRDRSTRSRVAL